MYSSTIGILYKLCLRSQMLFIPCIDKPKSSSENEQNFQYHLSYQIRCKTKHMHDSVNVLLYKQYLKKEKG